MTSFGKIILAGLVVAVVGVVLFVVSQKPTPPVVSTPTEQSSTPVTKQSEQVTPVSSSTDTSDQTLDKDTTSLDTQMNSLDSDISASTPAQ